MCVTVATAAAAAAAAAAAYEKPADVKVSLSPLIVRQRCNAALGQSPGNDCHHGLASRRLA
jgi:hypothetical protein